MNPTAPSPLQFIAALVLLATIMAAPSIFYTARRWARRRQSRPGVTR